MSENDDKLEWIRLAEMDLAIAHHLFMTFHPKPLEIICFHSQQAVEKMLKCYLVTHGIEPPKTHDIQLLLEMCLKICDDYDVVYEDAITLTNYEVRLRYPVELGLVELDAKKAIDIADGVMAHVKAKMVQEKAKNYKYTSMNYIELGECKNAEVLYDCNDIILLYDKSTTPAMLHYSKSGGLGYPMPMPPLWLFAVYSYSMFSDGGGIHHKSSISICPSGVMVKMFSSLLR